MDFVCVRIGSVYAVSDSISSNNEICEKAFSNELVLRAFPNPAKEFLTLEYVIPEEGELVIRIYNAVGKKVIPEIRLDQESGYYTNSINVSGLSRGIYHYSVLYEGSVNEGTFIKE